MLYEITHRTTYSYSSEVSVSHHVARLTPRTLPFQECLGHELEFEPRASISTPHTDYFGNRMRFFTIARPHRALAVHARSVVNVRPRESAPEPGSPSLKALQNEVGPDLPVEVREFTFASNLVRPLPELADYARASFPSERPLLESCLDLTRRIHQDFKFDPRATTVATPLEQVVRSRRGVCQDFAHIQIGCLRALGLPARYVSGYLETLPPPGQLKLTGSDASHAWVQVFIPSIGWFDFDPTNNLVPSERHVTVAYGRDFDDVSPLRGVIVGGGKHELAVAVDVVPLPDGAQQQQQQQQQ